MSEEYQRFDSFYNIMALVTRMINSVLILFLGGGGGVLVATSTTRKSGYKFCVP